MKKVSKILSLVIGLAICFASLCTSALAVSRTPEEEAAYLQSIIAEVDQFVYINESDMFALKDLPDKYSNLYPEMKKSIDLANELIQKLVSSGNITFNKDDKSFSSKFLTDPYGNEIDRFYWWGNQRKLSSENCKKAIKDFEELKKTTTVSKYQEEFINKVKAIQSLSKSRIEYDVCNFNISDNDMFCIILHPCTCCIKNP